MKEQFIAMAEHTGANTLLLNVSLGAMPNARFREQIPGFGRDVLSKLQAHQVTRVPAAAMAG